MTDITLEKRARELLAAEYENHGYMDYARYIRSGAVLTNGIVIRAIEAALRLSAGADWVLVPREPTAHMVNRAHDATDPDCNATCGEIVEIYRAMLAAAPRHETGEAES